MRNITETLGKDIVEIDLRKAADILMQGHNYGNSRHRKLYTPKEQNLILGYLRFLLDRKDLYRLTDMFDDRDHFVDY